MAGASPLPTLESERFQSRTYDKWDGIQQQTTSSSSSSFVQVILEQVVIYVGEVLWSGWIFEDFGVRGLFLEGQHWGDVDLRKGYVTNLESVTDPTDWLLFWILREIVLVVLNLSFI